MIETLPDGTIVAYLTRDFQPTDKDTAEMVEVTYPDGSVKFGFVPDAGVRQNDPSGSNSGTPPQREHARPKRFHGTIVLDPTRVGRDASRVADEVIGHLSGLVGAKVKVTLEVEAEIRSGAPDHVVRTVTENSRTLKFTSQGFEKE